MAYSIKYMYVELEIMEGERKVYMTVMSGGAMTDGIFAERQLIGKRRDNQKGLPVLFIDGL